ncbi:hypothetical protein WN944_021294 [Citrus x changshan-huyou]|uniref:Uncharacterized protein n=1 Tax=Citrus x changshan-huyou TaxID=2935761 RepID=A0AAP0QZE1_9ROSI
MARIWESCGDLGENCPPLKGSMTDVSGVPVAVTTGVCIYMNMRPGSPSGSDVSDSSAPGLSSNNSYNSSNIYKPVARSGGTQTIK